MLDVSVFDLFIGRGVAYSQSFVVIVVVQSSLLMILLVAIVVVMSQDVRSGKLSDNSTDHFSTVLARKS
jgi:hypothetical protein